jgi:hypothetical protein
MSLLRPVLHGVLGTLLCALAALLVTYSLGCTLIQGLSPETYLSDQVHQLNDEARWSRIDLAAMRVDPGYRETFTASHAHWGNAVRVADADITNLTLGNGGDATSLVTYQWVDERSMELYATTVRQTWTGNGEIGFRLLREDIIAGEPALYVTVVGGPALIDGNASMAASVDNGGMTTGGESAEIGDVGNAGPTGITASGSGPVASTPIRRDAQGIAIR